MTTDTILVTGGTGYIGSHGCKALAVADFTPTYNNPMRGHCWPVQWGPFAHGDSRDRARLDTTLMECRPCAVMHFAAHLLVGESMTESALYHANNVIIDHAWYWAQLR